MSQTVPRVLVLDDDRLVCQLIELALVEEGWHVQARNRGQDALVLLQQWAADVILLDMRMPDMDAEAFIAAYRAQLRADIPVLLVSGSTNLEAHAEHLGARGFLTKPFDIDDLCLQVRRIVVRGHEADTTDGTSDDH